MSAGPIIDFRGEFRFLSNFWMDGPFKVPQLPAVNGMPRMHPASGQDAASVEHAFQALKGVDPVQVQTVLEAPQPGEAKRRGGRVTIRPDWEDVKQDVMLACLRVKFEPGRGLERDLLNTGCRMLVEGNTWGDTTWGAVWTHANASVPGERVWVRETHRKLMGQNWLGRLLMLVRAELDCGVRR